ncbi:MAG: hypothetical protein WCJ56_01735 [bacterium]
MRRLILFLLCLAAITSVLAQDAQDVPVIAISKAQMAVRIKDPAKIRVAYTPIFELFSKKITPLLPPTPQEGKGKMPDINAEMTKFLTMPGLNANGEFWFVLMPMLPPTKADMAAYEQQKADYDAILEKMKNEGGEGLKLPKVPTKPVKVPMYLILPITDKALFQQSVQNNPEIAETIFMCDVPENYCVANIGTVPFENPAKLMVKFDQPINSSSDIVMVSSMKNQPALDMDGLGEAAMLMMPMMAYQQKIAELIDHTEIGLTVKGKDITMDTYVVPTAGSKFEKSLLAYKPTPQELQLPENYAGAMPKDLAAFSSQMASPEDLKEMSNQVFDQLLNPLLGMAVEGDKAKVVTDAMKRAMLLCENGSATGITNPNKNGVVNMVSIYKIADSKEAQAAIRDLNAQLVKLKDGVMGGVASKFVNIEYFTGKPDANGNVLDQVTVVFSVPSKNQPLALPPDLGGKEADVTKMMANATYEEVYRNFATISFQKDRMIVVMGPSGKLIVDEITNRARLRTTGFSSTPRYAELKKYAPAGSMAIGTMSTLDMANAIVSLIPPMGAEIKNMAKNALKDVKPQTRNILTYSQVKNGLMYAEVVVPEEQLTFISDMLTKGMTAYFTQMKPNTMPATDGTMGGPVH